MYDESFDVVNAVEVKSPSVSEGEDYKMAGKFNPPKVQQIHSDDYDETDTDSDPDGAVLSRFSVKNRATSAALQRPKSAAKATAEHTRHNSRHSSLDSDSDSNELEEPEPQPGKGEGERKVRSPPVWPVRGVYDPKKFANLKLTTELETLFQFIDRYTPQKIDIAFKLEPFVPDYIPAVGDVDPFIKVSTPSKDLDGTDMADEVLEFIDGFGLKILDEPSAKQSDAALLNLQLRAKTKTSSAKSSIVTKKLENPEKNSKAIDRWIKDVGDLHLSTPSPNVVFTCKMPDLDTLMEEWPESVEETLNNVGFPPASIDCSLTDYVDLVCGLFDIPIPEDTLNARIQALHQLFTLYSAVKSSQLYAERQKEESVI